MPARLVLKNPLALFFEHNYDVTIIILLWQMTKKSNKWTCKHAMCLYLLQKNKLTHSYKMHNAINFGLEEQELHFIN